MPGTAFENSRMSATVLKTTSGGALTVRVTVILLMFGASLRMFRLPQQLPPPQTALVLAGHDFRGDHRRVAGKAPAVADHLEGQVCRADVALSAGSPLAVFLDSP